jgi:hypothetical protein
MSSERLVHRQHRQQLSGTMEEEALAVHKPLAEVRLGRARREEHHGRRACNCSDHTVSH